MSQRVEQAKLVTTQSAIVQGQGVTQLALFDQNGNPVTFPGAASASTAGLVKRGVAVPNSAAADVATLVANFNSLLASLRTAGVIAP